MRHQSKRFNPVLYVPESPPKDIVFVITSLKLGRRDAEDFGQGKFSRQCRRWHVDERVKQIEEHCLWNLYGATFVHLLNHTNVIP